MLGSPKQFFVIDPKPLPDWILYNNVHKHPSYMSTNLFRKHKRLSYIDRIFYDLDTEGGDDDLSQVKEDALAFTNYLRREWLLDPFLDYSGQKGYHIFVWLQYPYGSEIEEVLLTAVYKALLKELASDLDLPSLDLPTIDSKRLTRIPYSRHGVSGRLCSPLDHKGKPILVKPGFVKRHQKGGLSVELVEETAETILMEWERRGSKTPTHLIRAELENVRIRPCFKAAAKVQLHGDKGHGMRLAMVAELANAGWGEEMIGGVFAFQSDYKSEITQKLVGRLMLHNPRRCDTIIRLGFCLGNSCSTYRKREGLENAADSLREVLEQRASAGNPF